MRLSSLLFRSILFSFCLLAAALSFGADAPTHVVFTYMGNPSSTITVNWQTFSEDEGATTVYYDTESRDGVPERYRHQVEGKVFQIEGLEDRFIYRTTLPDLEPATTYYLVAGDPETGLSREFKIKTIPEDDTPLRYVSGGDNGVTYHTRVLFRQAAKLNPDFALIGGDMAYANGQLSQVARWDSWFRYYTEEMVTEDGYSIPLVLAIGNHEVRGGFKRQPEQAPFFFNFFGQAETEGKSYFVRRFGANMVVFVLDTSHVASHASQVDWLRAQFEAHRDVKYKVGLYHVPLYPSSRQFGNKYSVLGRELWGPLFDEYGLTVGFEHHDHTFKRTYLLKGNEVSEEGTLYLGDGAWGVSGRRVLYVPPWYLRKSGSNLHFWYVEMGPEGAVYRAVNMDGEVFDIYPETEPEFSEAKRVFEASEGQEYYLDREAYDIVGYRGVGEHWAGGPTTIRFQNILDTPAWFNVSMLDEATIRAEGLPESPVYLEPGESHDATVVFEPVEGPTIPREDAGFRIRIDAKVTPEDRPAYFHIAVPAVPIRE